jgi:hypothetical protein
MTQSNDDSPGMVKTGQLVVGITPSVHSGGKSELIKYGEAILKKEARLKTALNSPLKSHSAKKHPTDV